MVELPSLGARAMAEDGLRAPGSGITGVHLNIGLLLIMDMPF